MSASSESGAKAVPRATYRLQLGPDLTFAQVETITPYLAALGVEALYLSPMLRARPEETPLDVMITEDGVMFSR